MGEKDTFSDPTSGGASFQPSCSARLFQCDRLLLSIHYSPETMPLQKLPVNGPLSVSASSGQRPQLQNRRRTLQTISELSSNEAGLPDFVSSIGIESVRRTGHDSLPGVARLTPKPSNGKSLPQHHSSPNIHAPRPSITVTPAYGCEALNPRSAQGCRPMPITTGQVEGWNAKRERARLQHELAIAEARTRQSTSDLRAESATNSRPTSIRYGNGQQILLRESKSFQYSSGDVERRASLGSTNNSASQYDARLAPSERASTDSSSYQSRDSAVHRSRSVSSNTSYASQDAPPLPHGAASDLNGYCSELVSQNYNLVAFGESARSKNANPRRSSRTMSLPSSSSKHASAPHRYVTASDLRLLPTQQSRPISAQRARNQALAALTAANSHMRTTRTDADSFPTPSTLHPHRHASLTSHPPNGSIHRNSLRYQAHLESQRRITSPAVVHLPDHAPRVSQRRQSDQPRRVSFEPRSVPKRESLTQWKKEREEARASLGMDHKARMQERVRRANELEQEREKELVEMGKRRSKGESRGCFGGLLSALRGGKS